MNIEVVCSEWFLPCSSHLLICRPKRWWHLLTPLSRRPFRKQSLWQQHVVEASLPPSAWQWHSVSTLGKLWQLVQQAGICRVSTQGELALWWHQLALAQLTVFWLYPEFGSMHQDLNLSLGMSIRCILCLVALARSAQFPLNSDLLQPSLEAHFLLNSDYCHHWPRIFFLFAWLSQLFEHLHHVSKSWEHPHAVWLCFQGFGRPALRGMNMLLSLSSMIPVKFCCSGWNWSWTVLGILTLSIGRNFLKRQCHHNRWFFFSHFVWGKVMAAVRQNRGKRHLLDSSWAAKRFARLTRAVMVWYPRHLRKQSPFLLLAQKKPKKALNILRDCPFNWHAVFLWVDLSYSYFTTV